MEQCPLHWNTRRFRVRSEGAWRAGEASDVHGSRELSLPCPASETATANVSVRCGTVDRKPVEKD